MNYRLLLVALLGSLGLPGLAFAAAFPTTLNNFQAGQVIRSADWNALEQTIGTTNSPTSTSLTYRLNSLQSTTSIPTLSVIGTITTGVWNGTAIGDAYLTKTGNWTGTFDGQEGSYYLDATNLTNFSTPFNSAVNASTTIPNRLCATNEILKWNGTIWTCATDSTGSTFSYLFPSNATSTQLTFSGGILVNAASSTITNLTIVNSTSTNATTSKLWVTDTLGCSGASALATDASGKIICDTDDNSGGGGGGANEFTYVQANNGNYLTPTSTAVGLLTVGSSTIRNLNSINATSTQATTTFFGILNPSTNSKYMLYQDDSDILNFQRASGTDDRYTLLQIKAPTESPSEATLALTRTTTTPSSGSWFMDVYNNGYAGGTNQFGIRLQKRGIADYNPFIIDFYDGSNFTHVLTVATDTMQTDLGFVGIGSSTPEERLTVAGNIVATGTIGTNAGGTGTIFVNRAGTSNFGSFELRTGGTSNWAFRQPNDGTSNAQIRDTVNGISDILLYSTTGNGIVVTGSSTILGNLNIAGNTTSTQATTTYLYVDSGGLVVNAGSSTIRSLTVVNSTTTNATTSKLGSQTQ